jgi:hypothetical protein
MSNWPAFRKHNEVLLTHAELDASKAPRTRHSPGQGVDIDRVHRTRQAPLPSISDRPAHKGYCDPDDTGPVNGWEAIVAEAFRDYP